MPLNVAEQAQDRRRWRWTLAAFHNANGTDRRSAVTFGVMVILTVVGSAPLLGHFASSVPAVLADSSLGTGNVWCGVDTWLQRTHNRFEPWCPYCRDGEDGEDSELEPEPQSGWGRPWSREPPRQRVRTEGEHMLTTLTVHGRASTVTCDRRIVIASDTAVSDTHVALGYLTSHGYYGLTVHPYHAHRSGTARSDVAELRGHVRAGADVRRAGPPAGASSHRQPQRPCISAELEEGGAYACRPVTAPCAGRTETSPHSSPCRASSTAIR